MLALKEKEKEVKAQAPSQGELEVFEVLKKVYRHELSPTQALAQIKIIAEG